MTIMESVFSVIGIMIIIGGFIYGFYDSYYQSKESKDIHSQKKEK